MAIQSTTQIDVFEAPPGYPPNIGPFWLDYNSGSNRKQVSTNYLTDEYNFQSLAQYSKKKAITKVMTSFYWCPEQDLNLHARK